MKKQLHSIRSEKGFILPSVLFLTTLVLLYFSSGLLAYKHDVQITYNMMEQVKGQSLFQLAYTQHKKDYLSHNRIEKNVEYSFPIGNVKINTTVMNEVIQLEFNIETNNDFSITVTKSSKVHFDAKAAP